MTHTRRTIAAANWKMFKTVPQIQQFLGQWSTQEVPPGIDVRIYVNALGLQSARGAIAPEHTGIGAQNFYPKDEGAFTGEISLPMLEAIGVQSVLVGHSERRHVFGESLDLIAEKVHAALTSGCETVLCVGETLAQRNAGETEQTLRTQISSALEPSAELDWSKLVIAYEPVWAIGTGETASAGQANQAHKAVRSALDSINAGSGNTTPVLYGGSVKPANAAELAAESDIDGVLVGGASLAVESWCDIVKAL